MESILNKRRIEWLMHFTQADNLPNILRYGLLPKTELLERGIPVHINDLFRYDACENAICMSIEFPNYKMLYKLRTEDQDVDWVVLVLDASILLDFDCAFCVTNAGSSDSYSVPVEHRKGKRAFLKLFDEYPGKPTREEIEIEDWHPTNPQAEILIFDTVPITYIRSVFFDHRRTLEKYIHLIPDDIEAKIKSKIFSYRNDWKYWRN